MDGQDCVVFSCLGDCQSPNANADGGKRLKNNFSV